MAKGFLSWVSSGLPLQRLKPSSLPKEEVASFALCLHRTPVFIPDFKGYVYHLSLKGILSGSIQGWSPPSGKHNCTGREGAYLAPSPKSMTGTQKAFALPGHIDTDVQVSFGVQRQVEWQENAENKKFSMPVHHSILTNILRVLILLCSICSA